MKQSGFSAGTLWSSVQRATEAALQCGALQPIETRQLIVPDQGVDFLVRQVSSLARKDSHKQHIKSAAPQNANPFLPHDPALFVTNVEASHLCLLNKFNVLDYHLLIVTRDFEHQETLLNESDFAAWFRCMREFHSLGFYNGGVIAGASQEHKHMQLVPLPLGVGEVEFPLAAAFADLLQPGAAGAGSIAVMRSDLPFEHGLVALDDRQLQHTTAAEYLLRCYQALLSHVGIKAVQANRQSASYNLLMTREWMWLVPRSRECFDSISVNALGFAGSLFVREERQLDALRRAGPMRVLRSVAMAL